MGSVVLLAVNGYSVVMTKTRSQRYRKDRLDLIDLEGFPGGSCMASIVYVMPTEFRLGDDEWKKTAATAAEKES